MNMMAAFDSVFCLFMMQPILMDKTIAASFFKVLSAYFGQPWDMQRLLKVGSDSVTQEFQFNQAAGVGKAVMPKMFVDENPASLVQRLTSIMKIKQPESRQPTWEARCHETDH